MRFELWEDPTPWMADGLCAQTDPEIFFPPDEPGRRHSAEPARRICRNCPVQAECLDFALNQENLYGIWGATTPNQRTRLRRKRIDVDSK